MVLESYDDSGVSEIIGALLLILIVVIAAAGLAMIVSQAQQQQASRQELQDAVSGEDLSITSILPTYDQYESFSIDSPLIYPLTGLDIDIQNLNVGESNIVYITVNGVFYNISSISGSMDNRMTVPASGNIHLSLDDPAFFSHLGLLNNQSITLQIGTSYGNLFTKTIDPPTASARFDVDTENLGLVQRDYVVFDGSGSNDSTGQIKIYKWDIVDESNGWSFSLPELSSSGSSVQFDTPSDGPFVVSLTVLDSQNPANAMVGQTDEMYIPSDPDFDPPLTLSPVYYQSNSTIVATLISLSGKPCPGQAIVFQPGSNIMVNPTEALTDSNGTAVVNVSYIPNATMGTVMVSYEKLTENVQVSLLPIPPTADFTSNTTSGDTPLTVTFADTSSGGTYGDVTAWEWSFDDGTANSTVKDPVHTFAGVGTYTVTLTVTNSYGSVSKQSPSYITVHNSTPTASFTSSITNGSPPLNVGFTDTSTGNNINSWQWNFGDNTGTDTQRDPEHTYYGAGNYTVTLTVANDGGSNTTTKTNYINIL
jgi:flagellin-like protein